MTKQSITFVILLVITLNLELLGQGFVDPGFEEEEWASIRNRWIWAQPYIIVISGSGSQFSGQPLHASLDTLYILPAFDIPAGKEWVDHLEAFPYSDINYMLLQKGGNRVTRSHRASRLVLPVGDKFFTPEFQALRKASVYNDSLVRPQKLEETFIHSRVLRQAFPDRHLRISTGIGFGKSRAETDAVQALEQSQLPHHDGSYKDRRILYQVDVSWRFWDRLIIGGDLFANHFSSYIYGSSYINNEGINYNYNINFFNYGFYAEYAFFHVDRYFTRKLELIAGAGFLMGKPGWSIYYNYDRFEEPDIYFSDYADYAKEGNINGLQFRTSFHYYFFPGASLWTGAEINLYRPWIVESVELPDTDPNVPLVLQEHTLSFSLVKLKFGVSIYL